MDAAAMLREVRSMAGLSLRELASLAATSHATLAAYEQGRKQPRLDTFVRICRAAGFEPDVHLDRRLTAEAAEATRLALLDVLALADAYPFARTGPLDAPVLHREVV